MNAKRLSTAVPLAALVTVLLAAACSPAATPMPAPQPTFAAMATQVVSVAATPAPAGSAGLALPPAANQMIIKNADVELRVADTDLALDRTMQLTADHGGYIISSRTWMAGDYKQAALTLGVPALQFEAALNRLRHVGVDVLRETTAGQDVSAEYTDLQARLINLEATSARVRDFLAAATSVTESLSINAELSALEGQIEQIKGQMRYYEGRAAYSTITVTLTPERQPEEPEPPRAWDPARTFQSAVRLLTSLSQTAADALIWFTVVCGPGLLLLAAAFGAFRFVRRITRR
jgi:hypothetical protein